MCDQCCAIMTQEKEILDEVGQRLKTVFSVEPTLPAKLQDLLDALAESEKALANVELERQSPPDAKRSDPANRTGQAD